MDPEVIAAIVGFFGTVIAAIIGRTQVRAYKKKMRSLEDVSFVRFMRPGETFKEFLPLVNSISMYTINSFELLNSLNTMLEQNPNITIKKITILLRKKDNETEEDLVVLEQIITLWRKWVDKKRIKNLEIIAYDHDPNHYYTLIGDNIVFCGQVMFDTSKPTGTTVNCLPLVFTNGNDIGQQVIKNYQMHFNNAYNKYKSTGLLYSSKVKS